MNLALSFFPSWDPEKSQTNQTTSIRYYLSERFRLRFEDAGIEEMIEEEEAAAAAAEAAAAAAAARTKPERPGDPIVTTENERATSATLRPPPTLVPARSPAAAVASSAPADTTAPYDPSSRDADLARTLQRGTTDRHPMLENENTGTATVIRTLDGEIAGDEMEEEAMNYQILLGKIDALLDRLKLDA